MQYVLICDGFSGVTTIRNWWSSRFTAFREKDRVVWTKCGPVVEAGDSVALGFNWEVLNGEFDVSTTALPHLLR